MIRTSPNVKIQKHREHFLLWWTRANQMENSEWYLLSHWLILLVIKKGSTSTKKSVKTPTNKFQIYCFVFNQSGWTTLLCLNQVLKPIWTDYLVYTRNPPDLTCHAFNNQSHEPTYTQIYHVSYTESTLHCTVAAIMWTV